MPRRKAVKKHLKAIADVRSFIAANRERVSRRLKGRPAAPSEEGFSYQPYFGHMDAELAAVARRLEVAEDAYGADKYQLAVLRRGHQQATSELFDLQSDTKRLLTGLLPLGLQGTLIAGATPRGDAELSLQVRDTVALLHDVDRFAPGPVAGITFDSEALAAELEAGRQQVDASSVALAEAQAGATFAGTLADEAATEAARVCLWVARGVQAFRDLAGGRSA